MGRRSTIPTIYDFCKQLSISDLKKWNYWKPDQRIQGKIIYTPFNSELLEISIEVNPNTENPFIELDYSIHGTKLNYRIYFEFMRSNLGNGKIWFFRCPFSNARCRKLYLIRGYFQNRTEHSKSFYQTQTVGTKDKYLIRQFDRLQKANKAEETIKRKYFKRFYNGKPTKRYLKLLKDFEAGAGISEAELFIK